MNDNRISTVINDALLSLLCGVVLLLAARAVYGVAVPFIPDDLFMPGNDPIARLASARWLLFTSIVAVLVLPLSWPLAKHAVRRDLSVAIPGAACAAALHVMLEQLPQFNPFPLWFSLASGAVLFVALPLATLFWWRRFASAA